MNRLILFLCLCCIFNGACNPKNDPKKAMLSKQSFQIGDEFYKNLKDKNYDKVYAQFSEGFYQKYELQNVKSIFGDIKDKYGVVKQYEILETKYTTSIKGGKEEELITNTYKVFYSSGFLAREDLTFVITNSTQRIVKVDGYTFDYFDPPSQ